MKNEGNNAKDETGGGGKHYPAEYQPKPDFRGPTEEKPDVRRGRGPSPPRQSRKKDRKPRHSHKHAEIRYVRLVVNTKTTNLSINNKDQNGHGDPQQTAEPLRQSEKVILRRRRG